jgi:hypothetical protein
MPLLNRIRSLFEKATAEEWTVILFGASFFVGVRYAFPMVNTITDVWAFGGGVLRAIEAHTLLPGYGVAYGTVSFYQNYLVMVVALCIGYVVTGFDLETLKTLLILNPSYSLLVPRVTSALTATALLGVIYRFLRSHVQSEWWRLTLLMLVFGNVLATLLTRSGKMWMLSTALAVVSFIYLYRTITEEVPGGTPGRLSAVSIVAAFLAAANFAFAAVFLINIPILVFVFPKTRAVFRRILAQSLFGAAVFLIIFALNAANTIEQVSGFVLQFFGSSYASVVSARDSLTLLQSFFVNVRQAAESFPLLLLALIPALRAGIRDRTLATLAALYAATYLIAVSIIFRADDGLALNVRHIFPICFFFLFLLAAYRPPARWISVAFLSVGCAIYVYTVMLLSIPATYNAAYDFIVSRYGEQHVRIDEHIFELTLPMNRASYALYTSTACGSACTHMRALQSDIAFKPLVITDDSDPASLAGLPSADLVVVEHTIAGCTALARFGNDVPDVFDIDINLGRMLLPSFYRLRQLGKTIYIYETRTCHHNL